MFQNVVAQRARDRTRNAEKAAFIGKLSVAKQRDQDDDWDRHAEKEKQNRTHVILLEIRLPVINGFGSSIELIH
jgi:hypothetical protein